MAHPRQTIRDALKTRLTGLVTTGANVFTSRIRPLRDNELPAIVISTGLEDMGGRDNTYLYGNLPIRRAMEVNIDICVRAVTGAEDTADDVLAEIEAALFDTPLHNALGLTCHSITEESVQPPELDESTDKPTLRTTLVLQVIYST